jgi:hypothetical protein
MCGFTRDELCDLSQAVENLIQDRRDYCKFEDGLDLNDELDRLGKLNEKVIALRAFSFARSGEV